MTKPVYGGKALAKIAANTATQVVLLRERTAAAPEENPDGAATVESVPFTPSEAAGRVRIVEKVAANDGDAVDLEDAAVVVVRRQPDQEEDLLVRQIDAEPGERRQERIHHGVELRERSLVAPAQVTKDVGLRSAHLFARRIQLAPRAPPLGDELSDATLGVDPPKMRRELLDLFD